MDGNPIPLRKQKVNGQDIPLPDPMAQGRPHTVIGSQISSKTGEIYTQTATFPGGTWPTVNGKDVPWSDNTAISLIELDDYFNITLKFYNDASHLPEELNPKRSRIGSYAGKGENEE